MLLAVCFLLSVGVGVYPRLLVCLWPLYACIGRVCLQGCLFMYLPCRSNILHINSCVSACSLKLFVSQMYVR